VGRTVLKKLLGGGSVLLLVLGLLALPFLQPNAHAATVSDNFSRANGGLGSNWTTVSGTTAPRIVNNTVQPGSAGTLNSAYWSANTFGGNQYAAASFPNSSGTNWGPAIAVRLSNSTGYFLWYGNSASTVSIWRMDSSSSWTQLKASATLTIAATDVWQLQAVGSTLTGYQNGKQVVTTTDTHYTTGAPGIWMYYAANQITNWSGGDVATAPVYSVGGTVSGLTGTVVLQDNGGDNLSVAANGSFTFPTQLASGAGYAVTVKTQPSGQTCAVGGGTGTVGAANVTSVAVTCTTSPPVTYSIGGTVSGLTGTVVLQDNGGDNLSVAANGSFTFPTKLAGGAGYAVTVKTQPSGQTCAVGGGTGTVGAANVTSVAVTCTTSGGSGTLTASDDFNRANGALGSNWTAMSDGAMTISSQVVAGGNSGLSGDTRTAETYTSNQYSQVQVTSTQLTGGQWIGPAVRSQNGGQNLYLGIYFWNSGSPQLRLYKRTTGSFTQLGSSYATSGLAAGATLRLTATGSTVSFLLNGSPVITVTDTSLTGGAPGIMAFGTGTADNWAGGNIAGGASYTIGGTVSGLSGTVVLNDNGGDALSLTANGAFTFPTPVLSGSAYNVTVANAPAGQTCQVSNGSGTVGSGNLTSVVVACAASSGGSSGLQVQYVGTDASGVQDYQVTSPDNGPGPQDLRVLQPSNPAPGVAHNFIYVLPVEPGEGTTFGDGLQVIQSLNLQNQYNLTVIEPSFSIDPWYADNPLDANLQEDTFMAMDLQPWVKANLSTTGNEQNWLIGFSKSGIGAQTLILRHPDKFTLAASWDFPADMNAYDEYGTNSSDSYGTDANFQANYRLTPAFLAAHAAPFQANNRIWIGGYQLFQQDMADYNTLLTAQGILHSTETPTAMAHEWDSGWVPIALAALETDSLNMH
jgi:putative esterase